MVETKRRNRRIELMNYSNHGMCLNTASEYCCFADKDGFDTVALCDYNSLYSWRDLRICSRNFGIRPMYGITFKVRTPKECLLESVNVICYAQNKNGEDDLFLLYHRRDVDGIIDSETFLKFKYNFIAGFDLSYNERLTLALGSVFENFLVPDFVLIDKNIQLFRCWRNAHELINKQEKVLLCATANGNDYILQDKFPTELKMCFLPMIDDETMLQDFAFLGDEAEDAVITNPRRIAYMCNYY